jgi:GR25 family glycosyltransferase involved in LPS biosynthesis
MIDVFIIHYKKLTERKEYLKSALKDFKVHWIEDVDRDTLTPEQLSMYEYSSEKWKTLNAVWKEYNSEPRPLSTAEIACNVSHYMAYKAISEKGIDRALILEDDVILYHNFAKKLRRVLDELPEDFDSCYLSDCFGWTVNNYKQGFLGSLNKNIYDFDKCVYRMPTGRCADSYVISNKCAKVMCEKFVPFCLPVDWQQTPIYLTGSMKVYWAEPALTALW